MIITVIISLKNSSKDLAATLESFSLEDPKTLINTEFLVIDSNSIDHPIDIISNYSNRLNIRFISGYDNSIYAAWNKGVALAGGIFVTFFGAGDLINKGALSYLMEAALWEDPLDIISAKSLIVYQNGSTRVSGIKYNYEEFKSKFTTNHAGLLYSKDLFYKFGNFSENYKISADYEFLLRIGPKIRAAYIDQIVSIYPYGGISSRSLKPLLEVYKVRKKMRILSSSKLLGLLIYGILAHYYRRFF